MWASIIGILANLVAYFFKPKTDIQVSHDDGIISGQSQQKASDQAQTLEDVRNAKSATDAVDRSAAAGVSVTTSDGFRRD